jgi:subtilisin-like proprotein convertase family protein
MAGRARIAVAFTLVAALALSAAAPVAAAPKKKGKGKGAGRVDITKPVNAPIPDKIPDPGPYGLLSSTITVGKQFKGRQVRDVNVTVQATGVVGMNAIADLRARLVAPNGASLTLFSFLNPGNLLGPLTLDDEAPFYLGVGEAPVDSQALYPPWQGSAEPGDRPLYVMDGGPVRGDWTLRVIDQESTASSVLNSWRLNIVAGRPFQTK